MDVEELSSQYASRPDDELAELVSSSYDLSESIVSSHPEMSQDAGFELFDRGWAQRYWKAVVSDITGLRGADQIQSWAVTATIAGAADAIIATFGLPAVAVSSAVALAVILLRAARAAAHEDSAEPDAGV